MTSHTNEELEVSALIESDSDILEQIRKDLTQEYVRFMSRMLKAQLESRGKVSVFNEPQEPSS